MSTATILSWPTDRRSDEQVTEHLEALAQLRRPGQPITQALIAEVLRELLPAIAEPAVVDTPDRSLLWEPPPPPKARTDNNALAVALTRRPGEWAVIRVWPREKLSSATSWARSIRTGAHTAFAAIGSFEAVARVVDGEARVYARCTRQLPAQRHSRHRLTP